MDLTAHTVRLGEHAFLFYSAIDTLPEDQRNAVELHYLQGCQITEVAKRMDRTATSVAGLLKRGLKKLRESFRKE